MYVAHVCMCVDFWWGDFHCFLDTQSKCNKCWGSGGENSRVRPGVFQVGIIDPALLHPFALPGFILLHSSVSALKSGGDLFIFQDA